MGHDSLTDAWYAAACAAYRADSRYSMPDGADLTRVYDAHRHAYDALHYAWTRNKGLDLSGAEAMEIVTAKAGDNQFGEAAVAGFQKVRGKFTASALTKASMCEAADFRVQRSTVLEPVNHRATHGAVPASGSAAVTAPASTRARRMTGPPVLARS